MTESENNLHSYTENIGDTNTEVECQILPDRYL